MRKRLLVIALLACIACRAPQVGAEHVTQRDGARGPRVLGIVAHPDDETSFAATLYKITTALDGVCDLAVITNGEGGFKYSTLAERIYGCELTDEAIGRARLPAIRKVEQRDAATILGVRDVIFLDQLDHRYTTDTSEVLGSNARVWDLALVRARLREIVERGHYDFVFTLAPTPDTHAHHKAATILALETVQALPSDARPIVLCARVPSATSPERPPVLDDWPVTKLAPLAPFTFERTQKFGFKDALDYRVVVNWVIAAHKSQGTMQLAMNEGEREQFFAFAVDPPRTERDAKALFEALAKPQFPAKTYGASAGANAVSN